MRIIESVKQPIVYPNILLVEVWDWFGLNGVFFESSNNFNDYNHFLECFDILYINEGILFCKVNKDKRKSIYDINEIFNDDISVFYMYNEHEGKIKENNRVELESSISEDYFKQHIYKKNKLRESILNRN